MLAAIVAFMTAYLVVAVAVAVWSITHPGIKRNDGIVMHGLVGLIWPLAVYAHFRWRRIR